jgi:hypothetical protein
MSGYASLGSLGYREMVRLFVVRSSSFKIDLL